MLSTLANSADLLNQVRKTDLHPGDWVFVKTVNSLYQVKVLGGGLYLASGGWFDKKGLMPIPLSIAGCTWGGSAIKVDVVAACGMRLEFGNRLITSPIQKIVVLSSQALN